MFFRIKKIKGKEYAYIVENEWKGGSVCGSTGLRSTSRQRVRGYIGRAYRFNLKNDVDFSKFMDIQNLEAYSNEADGHKILNDLIEWEIFKFGISRHEFLVDLKDIKVQKNNRNVVFLINDGFMCSYTLKSLLDFKGAGDEQADARLLARAFVEAGIKIPQEVFIGLYERLYKTTC